MMRLRTMLVISISVCFCLLQMQILTAYGEGVNINFSGVTVPGVNISTQSWRIAHRAWRVDPR